MARLNQAQRDKLPAKDFGLPKQRAYPMEDRAHARAALAYAARFASPGEQVEIRHKACSRYGMCEENRQHGS